MYFLTLFSFVFLSFMICCYGDVYLHNPRGSNNRLNENTAQRRNANRLFDSQNNNRGGYNKGDKDKNAAGNNYAKQYHMKFFQSGKNSPSELVAEWTNQHGLGADNEKLISNVVLQYMCQEDKSFDHRIQLRDGVRTNTQGFSVRSRENERAFRNRRNVVNRLFGLHESFENYHRCSSRTRNKRLFIADRKLNRDSATRTRQNNNGQRRGYECPEERDYYPYWHPTLWKDIAVLTSNTSRCEFYTRESFNVQPRHECVQPNIQSSKHNNKEACESDGGTWTEFHNYLEVLPLNKDKCDSEAEKKKYRDLGFNITWANYYDHDTRKIGCLVLLEAPVCDKANYSRVNHLGNTKSKGNITNLQMAYFNWKLPFFPSDRDHRCVFRIRYNITTADYDPWNTDSDSNNANLKNLNPPVAPLVENDPKVDVGIDGTKLTLAINTAQFGRTFQDRSHVFIMRSREKLPENVANKKIHNWNVRGKRGNIVQTYPANEYDFTPETLVIKKDELVHVQWTGSNTHNNGGNGGDGQAGDAGEGKGGTDRHNMLPLQNLSYNFPMALEVENGNIFQKCSAVWIHSGKTTDFTNIDVAVQFASSGYFKCENKAKCGGESVESKNGFNPTLDTSPASFEGAIFQCPAGTYHVVCTRNNNFSNRSQKGTLIVQ